MEGDSGISLILGRPFLRDAKATIDVDGNVRVPDLPSEG
jgi:hypothetical protein